MAYNKKEVLQANTEAIRVVLRLEKERREATETEKSILRNYQGFGGLNVYSTVRITPMTSAIGASLNRISLNLPSSSNR